jgi:hypothetical protein
MIFKHYGKLVNQDDALNRRIASFKPLRLERDDSTDRGRDESAKAS